MTLIVDPSPHAGQGTMLEDTQPFDFSGSDFWGNKVRGSIVALDAADAMHALLSRRITADSVSEGARERGPYTVELTVVPRPSASVADLVRRVMANRR